MHYEMAIFERATFSPSTSGCSPDCRCRLILLLCFLFANLLWPASIYAQGSNSAHLVIIDADILEVGAMKWGRVADRNVRLRIILADIPSCEVDGEHLAYGFLFDADNNPQTGQILPEFEDLGIDARISVSCDTATGNFVSRVGKAIVNDDNGLITLDVITTISKLPSVDFQWIAYAASGDILTNFPVNSAGFGWTIAERAIW